MTFAFSCVTCLCGALVMLLAYLMGLGLQVHAVGLGISLSSTATMFFLLLTGRASNDQ